MKLINILERWVKIGRTKGTLICKHCRRSNPKCERRVIDGCGHCYKLFPEDNEIRELKRTHKVMEDGKVLS